MTMTLIETKTLVSAAASIEFTSIPQTFTDLVILASLRSNNAANVDVERIEFNSVGTNLTRLGLRGNGSTIQNFTTTSAAIGISAGNNATANTFGNSACYIPNYTSANFKSFSADGVSENNATEAFQDLLALLWADTSAITSFRVFPNQGTLFSIGSTISLYGILKGSDGIVTTS